MWPLWLILLEYNQPENVYGATYRHLELFYWLSAGAINYYADKCILLQYILSIQIFKDNINSLLLQT